MATDLTKLPLEILVDLINETNGTALTVDDIDFGQPFLQLNGSRNTGITITAKPDSLEYSGYRDITYDRINLGAIPGNRIRDFARGNAVTSKDLIPTINAAYQLNLRPEDYFDEILPTFGTEPGETHPFKLRAKPASLIYTGELEITMYANVENLNLAIDTAGLYGFVAQSLNSVIPGDGGLQGFSTNSLNSLIASDGLGGFLQNGLNTVITEDELEGFSLSTPN